MPLTPAHIMLPDQIRRLAVPRLEVITSMDLSAGGLDRSSVRSLIRSGVLTPVMRGAYVIGSSSPTAAQRGVAAGLLHPLGTLCLETAAMFHGWRDGQAGEVSHLWLPPDHTRHQGRCQVRLHWSAVAPEEVVHIHGVAVTDHWRTARDALRHRSRNQAICLLDQGVRLGHLHNLADLAPMIPRSRRAWLTLVDGRSEVAHETLWRLAVLDAGLPTPDLQHNVIVGTRKARLDIAWPKAMIGLECDGRDVHSAPAALFGDRGRQNSLVAGGWTILRVTWADLADPSWIFAQIRQLLAQAA